MPSAQIFLSIALRNSLDRSTKAGIGLSFNTLNKSPLRGQRRNVTLLPVYPKPSTLLKITVSLSLRHLN